MRVLSQNGYDDRIFSFGLNGFGHTQLAQQRRNKGADDSVRSTPRGVWERQPSPRAPSIHPPLTCGCETHILKGSLHTFCTLDLRVAILMHT